MAIIKYESCAGENFLGAAIDFCTFVRECSESQCYISEFIAVFNGIELIYGIDGTTPKTLVATYFKKLEKLEK